ncbi:transcriptional regulator [Mycolicibacterium novocastrense]|uniref:Transcriptional regulator n=1 Tax=Mycolicibacterium novocastrense TaxID=59813 RepID=A0ABQ0KSW5_MYCNV|nr:transcriptional regulator [Mycolicibacterium novocastrense]
MASDTAKSFCLSFFHQLDVDWQLHGFDSTALEEFAEMTLCTVQSTLPDPGQPIREGAALRGFVARWLGPAILYLRMAALSMDDR